MKFKDWNKKEHLKPHNEPVSWRPSAYGLIINDGKVLLVKSKLNGLWELPGGGVELSESLIEGLIREVYEETGYKISVIDDNPLLIEDTNFYALYAKKYFRSIPMVFHSDIVDFNQKKDHIDFDIEISDIKWFEIDKLPKIDLCERAKKSINLYLKRIKN